MIWYGIILISAGLLLSAFSNSPVQVLQIVIVLFPVLLAIGAGYVMYCKNSHKRVEAFVYSSGALVLAASFELIFLFFTLQFFNKMDVYSQLINQFQGLEFPIAIFALAISLIMGIEANVAIRKELSEIKGMIRTHRYRRFS